MLSETKHLYFHASEMFRLTPQRDKKGNMPSKEPKKTKGTKYAETKQANKQQRNYECGNIARQF
ncbi:hypothetical protein XJ32_03915 [Helicobacter bilis]|uniref:Uncharacterized protein n=1 Tax=Helicobacter bilis TaxID=37372 RepID=A0A1Q2LG88_9HELI|nr:hypothetical protein XJ32_03915 [Helicobacter bilis]